MGANKADVDNPVGIVDPHDESVLVPRDIENHSAVFKYAGIPEVILYFGRWTPVGMQGMTVPGQCWLLGILVFRVLFPEGFQRRQCDDSHVSDMLVPKWDFGNKKFWPHIDLAGIISLGILV